MSSESQRYVLFDRRQQMSGGNTRIDVEIVIEEFCVAAF